VSDFFTGKATGVTENANEYVETFEPADCFGKRIERLSECILYGVQPSVSVKDSRNNAAALVALTQAAREEGVVTIELL